MNKKHLIKLIDNNVTYHKQSETVKLQFPPIREQIIFGIDQLNNSVKDGCVKDFSKWLNENCGILANEYFIIGNPTKFYNIEQMVIKYLKQS